MAPVRRSSTASPKRVSSLTGVRPEPGICAASAFSTASGVMSNT